MRNTNIVYIKNNNNLKSDIELYNINLRNILCNYTYIIYVYILYLDLQRNKYKYLSAHHLLCR